MTDSDSDSVQPSTSELLKMIEEIFPVLDDSRHKGQAGRVGVIGGSEEYTGAPFFAAITSMKVGADQAHVFCAKDAAMVIKSYSPDLIVHPTLDAKSAEKDISSFFERLSVLVIGPGLGRHESILKTVENLIMQARQQNLPVVIDADGLWLINQRPDIIKGYNKAILTPNVAEAQRLWSALKFSDGSWDSKAANVNKMSRALGNVCLMVKGGKDLISDGTSALESIEHAGLKRCGGQGDVLSGAIAAFFSWTSESPKNSKNELLRKFGPAICAAFAASTLTRRCSKLAFEEFGRSMVAADMLKKIPEVVRSLQCAAKK